MAKWNPSSSVNSNHLLTIVRRGDLAYLTYIRDLTMLSVANELNPLTIQVGEGEVPALGGPGREGLDEEQDHRGAAALGPTAPPPGMRPGSPACDASAP